MMPSRDTTCAARATRRGSLRAASLSAAQGWPTTQDFAHDNWTRARCSSLTSQLAYRTISRTASAGVATTDAVESSMHHDIAA